jgi:hypothetical protein
MIVANVRPRTKPKRFARCSNLTNIFRLPGKEDHHERRICSLRVDFACGVGCCFELVILSWSSAGAANTNTQPRSDHSHTPRNLHLKVSNSGLPALQSESNGLTIQCFAHRYRQASDSSCRVTRRKDPHHVILHHFLARSLPHLHNLYEVKRAKNIDQR